MLRAFRFHYSFFWLLLLGFTQWRVGSRRSSEDEFMAGVMQLLCFPASLLAAVAIALISAVFQMEPRFWDTRLGSFAAWALFFASGFVQWFVVVPWVVKKVRSGYETPDL